MKSDMQAQPSWHSLGAVRIKRYLGILSVKFTEKISQYSYKNPYHLLGVVVLASNPRTPGTEGDQPGLINEVCLRKKNSNHLLSSRVLVCSQARI